MSEERTLEQVIQRVEHFSKEWPDVSTYRICQRARESVIEDLPVIKAMAQRVRELEKENERLHTKYTGELALGDWISIKAERDKLAAQVREAMILLSNVELRGLAAYCGNSLGEDHCNACRFATRVRKLLAETEEKDVSR